MLTSVFFQSIEDEINLAGYTLTEKKVFFTISQISENKESCNITDVIKELNNQMNQASVEQKFEDAAIIRNKIFALNGLILENDNEGITYSSIGVNGAKSSDFNKFPLFFEQLPALEADLYVISLGTNESFDKQDKYKRNYCVGGVGGFYSKFDSFDVGEVDNRDYFEIVATDGEYQPKEEEQLSERYFRRKRRYRKT